MNVLHRQLKKILAVLILSVLYYPSFSQANIREFVQKEAIPFNIPEGPDDFSDLEKFGIAIGNSRIVLLGEQSHGDATAFKVKTRLVKYLHEKLGFDVLAFESDFFALNEGWESIRTSSQHPDSFIRKNIFPIWSECHTCSELLYQYIPGTLYSGHPLVISGFDTQLHGQYSIQHFGNYFFKQLSTQLHRIPLSQYSKDSILRLLDSVTINNKAKDTNTVNSLISILNSISEFQKSEKVFNPFMSQLIKSLRMELFHIKAIITANYRDYHVRDQQMADNLYWLLKEKYPDKKIIVWAHNYHISRNSLDYFDYYSTVHRSMGSILADRYQLKDSMYIAGFTSYKGETKWVNNQGYVQKIPLPEPNSFENWINSDYQYAFVDFRKYHQNNPDKRNTFSMKGSIRYTHRSQAADWTNIFDGVIFIREMYGCR